MKIFIIKFFYLWYFPYRMLLHVTYVFDIQGLSGGEVEHERVGDIYPSLNNLLKSKSCHFSQSIVRQEFIYKGQKEGHRPEDDELFTTAPEVVVEVEEPTKSIPADQPSADTSPQTTSQ